MIIYVDMDSIDIDTVLVYIILFLLGREAPNF